MQKEKSNNQKRKVKDAYIMKMKDDKNHNIQNKNFSYYRDILGIYKKHADKHMQSNKQANEQRQIDNHKTKFKDNKDKHKINDELQNIDETSTNNLKDENTRNNTFIINTNANLASEG